MHDDDSLGRDAESLLEHLSGESADRDHAAGLLEGLPRFHPLTWTFDGENLVPVRNDVEGKIEPSLEPEADEAVADRRELHELGAFAEHDLRDSGCERRGLQGL